MHDTEEPSERPSVIRQWLNVALSSRSICIGVLLVFLLWSLILAGVIVTFGTGRPAFGAALSSEEPENVEVSPTKAPLNPEAYASTQIVYAQAVRIGNTGVRCFVGNASTACVSGRTPFDANGHHNRWSAVLSVQRPGITENGFEPGSQVPGSLMKVGDLVGNAGTIGYISAIGDKDATVRVADREVPYRELFSTTDSFEGLFRPNPDDMTLNLKDGASTNIHGWRLSLEGDTLSVNAAGNTWTLRI